MQICNSLNINISGMNQSITLPFSVQIISYWHQISWWKKWRNNGFHSQLRSIERGGAKFLHFLPKPVIVIFQHLGKRVQTLLSCYENITRSNLIIFIVVIWNVSSLNKEVNLCSWKQKVSWWNYKIIIPFDSSLISKKIEIRKRQNWVIV